MIADNVPEAIRKDFYTWNCFIVWTEDVDKLRKISAFYNRVNHLTPFKPTWAMNILVAHAVWEKYGKPLPKHSAAGVTDVRTSARRPPGNDKQFEVIQQRLFHPSLARFELKWSTMLSTMLLELIHIFNSDNEILALELYLESS